MLDATQIAQNWDTLIEKVNTEFSGERKERLLVMYDFLKDRALIAPASSREHFHNAFPGGYLDHVLRVMDFAEKEAELWSNCGATIDFTREELVFSSMHHDLSKLGDLEHPHYVPNESQWHREKMGMMYKMNEHIINVPSWMQTFFLLQHFGVVCTKKEMMGIQCTDGLYSPDTETILKQSDANKQLLTNLPLILHHADMMAYRVEYNTWLRNKSDQNSINTDDGNGVFRKKNLSKIAETVNKVQATGDTKSFSSLFN